MPQSTELCKYHCHTSASYLSCAEPKLQPCVLTGLRRIRPRHRGLGCDKNSSEASLPCMTAGTLLHSVPMISNCFHSMVKGHNLQHSSRLTATSRVMPTGSTGSQEPALWTPPEHRAALKELCQQLRLLLLFFKLGEGKKRIPAVFATNSLHY